MRYYLLCRGSQSGKDYLIYAFFIVRKIIAHWVTFFFYCIVIPTSVLVPEFQLTKPIAIYIPATITLLNAVCTPRYQKIAHRNIKFHFYTMGELH